MSSEIDHLDDVGRSANDRRWLSLLRLTEKLSEGIELDELVREVEENKPGNAVSNRHVLDHGILKKNKNLGVLPPVEKPGKKSGLKICFKKNPGKVSSVVCAQELVSWKITIKKPCGELQRGLLSKGKRKICFDKENASSEKIKSVWNSGLMMIPEAVKNRILDTGGSLESVVLVIQKELYQTDVSTSHGRLSIPHGKVKNQFLTSTEVDQLESTPIAVTLVQPRLQECRMSLRNWKSNNMYALVADWNKVCHENGLTQGMIVQLWSFRRNSTLCFALVLVD